MSDQHRIRQSITFEAARLLHEGKAHSAVEARHIAARSMYRGYVPPEAFPTDAEVSLALQQFELPMNGQTPSSDDRDRCGEMLALLRPLERIDLPNRSHLGCNALDHSLRAFQHVRSHAPFDDDVQAAALLQNVGWAIDPHCVEAAALMVVTPLVGSRVIDLLELLSSAVQRQSGQLGTRARARLSESSDSEAVEQLVTAHRAACSVGDEFPSVESAVADLAELIESNAAW